jgi:hypothetical protein
MSDLQRYFQGLSHYVAAAWNRFWFRPSDALDLCVMRFCVGLLAFLWHTSFAFDLVRWYGPDGWLAGGAMQRLVAEGADRVSLSEFSYLYWITDPRWLWAIHLLGSIVLLALMLGVYSRWAAIASLVVLVSDIHRAPLLTGPEEPVLTMMVAYLCLAPIGQHLSWDAWRRRSQPLTVELHYIATVSRRLIQVHLVLIYLVMGLTKLSGATWWYGEAVWWLAAQPDSQWFNPAVLRSYSVVLNLWTHAIVIGELSFAVLIWNRWFRPLVLVVSGILWCSVAVASGYIGLALTMVVANLAFVPGSFWRARLGEDPLRLRGWATGGPS